MINMKYVVVDKRGKRYSLPCDRQRAEYIREYIESHSYIKVKVVEDQDLIAAHLNEVEERESQRVIKMLNHQQMKEKG